MQTKHFILIFVLLFSLFQLQAQTYFGTQQVITTSAEAAHSVYSIDLDNDGDLDILSASGRDNKIAWYENNGNGNFGTQQVITTSTQGAYCVYAADFDGDGDFDVLSASFMDDKIIWYKNDGNSNFVKQQVITTSADGVMSVYAADLDGDGDLDILSASYNDDKIAWYENDGSGNFESQQVITTFADKATSVYAEDLDNDGDFDVLSASYNDDKIAWYENDGNGNFGAQQVITNFTDGAWSVSAKDLDGDGDFDVLSASYSDNKIAWYENDGNGNFGAQQVITTSTQGPSYVSTSDLDNDGDFDVLSVSEDDDKIAWYENDGNGNFGAQQVITTLADGAASVFVADLDNDGDLDVLSASAGDDKIAWYENITFIEQVQNQSVCPNLEVVFHINVQYSGSFLWQVNDGNGFINITDNDIYSGSATNILTITEATKSMSGYKYRCLLVEDNINSDIAVLNVDITPPETPSLSNLTGECSVTATAPTTTDNCAGTVTGTTNDPLEYTEQGTYTINWTFDDGNGNTTTAQQTVTVDDVTAPETPTLETLTGECSVTATAPTTTDNCAGTVTGTTTDPTEYTEQGTYTITWTFDDGNGNTTTAQQTVTVDDVTAPETPSLETLTGECSVTATAPTTTDNCAGTVTATTNDPLEYTEQGTHTITWIFNDGNGNTTTAQQTVTVDDVTAPEITCVGNQTVDASETHFYMVQGTEFDPANTSDNCEVASVVNDFNNIATLANAQLPEGTTTITWTITDKAGNENTCNLDVSVNTFVGIETLQKHGISVYPNPTTGVISIEFGTNNVQKLTITDLTGRVIFQKAQPNQNATLDLSNFANGIYIISIENNNKVFKAKVIKE